MTKSSTELRFEQGRTASRVACAEASYSRGHTVAVQQQCYNNNVLQNIQQRTTRYILQYTNVVHANQLVQTL